ncbi:MAG: DUF1538 domain-containing protein [Corallococcus sp.]|nr:DUF1538 domain-containing protein [Corallococcus sp.]MCM1360106.1 DUF1538 domain-containing protein [Corallococcus sp.]MCM1395663.1 DUF1538 domain-containing protein [Corallococcus sp.]
MGHALWVKTKESVLSVLPVVVLVLLLCCTPFVSLSGTEIGVFCVSALLAVLGISLFNLGADIAMTPMGDYMGTGLTKSKKLSVLLTVCFAMGVLITVAEPDLSVLASQISAKVNPTVLIISVGVGVGAFLLLAVLKMVFKVTLSWLLMFFYMCLFALAALLIETGNMDFLALSFDSGGVTTGPITVPFIMALGVGISQTLGGKNSTENSFGLIAMCSIGPILAVLILGVVSGGGAVEIPTNGYELGQNIVADFFSSMWSVTKEVALSLGLIAVFFFVFQFICLKLPKQKLWRIVIGLVYTFVGLVLFLTAVSAGFMKIGYKLGEQLAGENHPAISVIFAFILGAVVVLAEPAVRVLNKQVEEVTEKAVSKRSMMLALSIGVGIAIGLSVLRIWLHFSVLYYLIPGYLLSLGLSFFVPKLYTAIAFDSGGVASGPLTSSFILPFAIGVCVAADVGGKGAANILTDAFGVVALVAMTPLITIQLLGFRAIMAKKMREKIAMNRILNADDEQIINFM